MTTVFACPKCAHLAFSRRGYLMACSDCGWDSETGCGADGFDMPGHLWERDDRDVYESLDALER